MINCLEDIRVSIGVDANTFYQMLLTLITAIVPFIIGILKSIKVKRENNLFDLHGERESDFFFGWVLLLDVSLAAVVIFLYIIIHAIVMRLWKGFDIWGVGVYILLLVLANVFVLKRFLVRKRLLDKRHCKWLICMPIYIFGILFYTAFEEVDNVVYGYIFMLILFVVEILGMWQFRGRYVRYDYSGVIFYLNSGIVIECKDISQIRRKRNTIIIQEENVQTRFKYDDVSKVKYYGACGVKLL